MDDQALERALLALVRQPDYRPAKPRVIARRLALAGDRVQALERLIKKLGRRGDLVCGSNRLVGPAAAGAAPRAAADQITGVFRRALGGFGFVRPAGAAAGAAREQDIYVAAEDARDASTGDVVLLRLAKDKKQWRLRGPRGVIVEVIERETHQFVGTYFEVAGSALVQVDGKLFAQPIAVGDPGAKSARPDDKVVFEMVRFPSHAHDGEGVITEVLGSRGAPGVDTLSIIREFNLPDQFAPDALAAARAEADRFDESVAAGRLDLTGKTTITIDPSDARDFDDAISLERTENGHWLLGVHIADVSHFVRPHTPLDREAYQRGTSVYLPDRVVPMLPEIISNGLASLQPGRVRYTKTALLEFTSDGVQVATDLSSAAIKSRRRFTYDEIDQFLARPAAWRRKLSAEVNGLVGRMHELAMILRRRRWRRGALELSLEEVKVDLDKDGRVAGAHRVENTESHQIIEEFMLAANEAVAQRLSDAGWLFLRRVHQAPDPRKLKALGEFVSALGFPADGLESRFELQRLLAGVAGRPEQHAVNYALLRSLQRAVYSPQEEGHYALASDCYCHFTSPIRRYPDLAIHRLVDALLAGRKPPNDFGALAVLGEHCSDREQRAEAAERELTKVKLLSYLAERIGEELDAVVTGVEEYGLFVQGIELPAEGLVHVTSLADDFYDYDRRTHTLAGRRSGNSFRLGDHVRVTVARVDMDRRELDFRLVRRRPHRATADKTGRAGAASPRRPSAGDTRPAKHRARTKPRRQKPGRGKREPAKRGKQRR